MSRVSLVSRQTIKIHNCLINEEKHDLVIKSHKQKIGYNRKTNKKWQ